MKQPETVYLYIRIRFFLLSSYLIIILKHITDGEGKLEINRKTYTHKRKREGKLIIIYTFTSLEARVCDE